MGSLMIDMGMDFWFGKKVLITGHTGFKGSWLTYWLNEYGAEICGISLDPQTSPSLWHELELDLNGFDIRSDIRGDGWIEKLKEFQPEIVFHLAAQPLIVTGWKQPLMTFETNVLGTGNLLDQLNQIESVQTILIVTTDKVYKLDEQKVARREDSELGGNDPYAASKAAVELLVESWPLRQNIRIATARSGNVIGGGDWSEDRLIPDIIRAGLAKNDLEVRFPEAIRPWQHVIEPIHGYMMLAQSMHSRTCDATAVNFGPLVENQITVEEIISYSNQILPSEYRFNQVLTKGKYQESSYLILNSDLAKNLIRWSPVLDWKQSVNLALKWYVDFLNGVPARDLVSRNIEYYLEVWKGCQIENKAT